MSELNERNCGPEGLPLFVRRYTYRKEYFSQIVDLERERLHRSMHSIKTMSNGKYTDGSLDASEDPEDVIEYIIFSIDTATHDRDFLDPNIEPNRSIRTTFDQNLNSLAVKMVLHEHEELSAAFDMAIGEVLGPMGLKKSIYRYRTTTLPVANGSKEPDAAWGPRRPPSGSPRRPTVVVETAISEMHAKLLRDVGQGLDPVGGLAKVVLAIKADRRKPRITIERWQYDSAKAEIENIQTIEIIESSEGDEVTVTGGPLLIPFHLFFLRPAEPPREDDILIDEQELRDIAQLIWEIQFTG
ncbi:hypothetical protein N7491_004329 [Penicillium cf. griseofulvum]|uniref:Uncharacterized protein n=1 Tax=Penicillium cf. griseofulvum TaxID=2972120 RepID=A0A9W9J1P0_9EURO|nr:hypothetical protein N7472_007021 [Penicillium cf. griseofulvum]KAJ5433734.1 hypothetical protein N7491_004329 [Penicillium cf. griseofulvum]